MYVGLKQPRGDGERYVTPARAAAKETRISAAGFTLVQKVLRDIFSLGYIRKQIIENLKCQPRKNVTARKNLKNIAERTSFMSEKILVPYSREKLSQPL